MQNMHPIAFERRKLWGPELLYTIYDKEMLAIRHVLDKFKKYLVEAKFIVRTKPFWSKRTSMKGNISG